MSKHQIYLCTAVLSLLFLSSFAYAQPELDISFNGTGRVTTDLSNIYNDIVHATLIQPDDKIVAVGRYSSSGSPGYFALVRYNTNGSLDPTFGNNGIVITDFDVNAANEGALAGALQPDGKILASGYVDLISPGPGYFATARYNTDGSLDPTFGNGGKVLTSIIENIHEAHAVAVGLNGTIVVAGNYLNGPQGFQTLVARYRTDGFLEGTVTDTRFFDVGDRNATWAIALQPDGKIVTAGRFSLNGSSLGDITMLRLTPTGAYDTSFAGTGRLYISSPATNEGLFAVAVQPDGRIVAAGESGTDFLVMRLNSDGSPDTTFDTDGRVTTYMGAPSQANGLVIRPNGKIMVAGLAGANFAAASYNADGSLDTSFSGDGKLTFQFGLNSRANSIATDSLGRVLLGGHSDHMGASSAFAVVRLYTPDPQPVVITGRALSPEGQPLRMVRVSLTDSRGVTRYYYTSSFGYFRFEVPSGQTCSISASSKGYSFTGRTIAVNGAISDLDLIGTRITQRPAGPGVGRDME
jgi:uncharacterized delta-60 repeat protein